MSAASGPWRPTIRGTRHMVSAGHYLAAEAGFAILEAGGNAIDAGVAAGIAIGVVQSDLVNVAGVAPIMIYLAETDEVLTISGLGTWPCAATLDFFIEEHGGVVPQGIERVVVPAAPDAWITALARYGTMRLGEVAAAAIRFARDGFVMYPLMAELIESNAEGYARWPANAAVYLPGGRPPRAGEMFVQADLGRSLQFMADEEAAAGGDREAGLDAARAAFYQGDIARAITDYHRGNGGLLTMADMAGFRSEVERPLMTRFGELEVYACGPWCQGPVLLQMLTLIDGMGLGALGHNSPAYVHMLTEAMKLAFADRDRHYTDPRLASVPMAALLSPDYAAARRGLIDPGRAWPGMPPAGDPTGGGAVVPGPPAAGGDAGDASTALDTSYVAVVDRHGNAFSATPSDVAHQAPMVPGTGLCPSSRGSQSWAVTGHPGAVAPGKRPRLTPNPALARRPGRTLMPFGTPGGDVQCQAMLQTLLNMEVFGMAPQAAVEAPRFATYSFPGSFEPHAYAPGRLTLEGRIAAATGECLAALGHGVEWWPERTWRAGGVCLVAADLETGVLSGAADPRRESYAVGW